MNLENNHPIHYDDILVTHNGHISNDNELFISEDLGRQAEVDSEIIAALFQKHGIDKAHIPLQKLDGNMAIAITDLRKPGTLVLAKGSMSPLEYYYHKNGIIWASTKKTIEDALQNSIGFKPKWNDIESLSYGEILLLENGTCEKLEYKPLESWKGNYSYKSGGAHSSWTPGRWENNWERGYSDSWKDSKSYTIRIGNDTITYRPCDNCDISYQTKNLEELGDMTLCQKCYEVALDWVEEIDVNEDTAYDNPMNYDDPDVHEIVCELIADKNGTQKEFVNWILFDTDDADIADETIQKLYLNFVDDYDDMYRELTDTKGKNKFPAGDRLEKMETEKDQDPNVVSLENMIEGELLADEDMN